MNRGLRIECFRLALALNVVGFWTPVHPPVHVVLDKALRRLRATRSAKVRRNILDRLYEVAECSPDHTERVTALEALADYFYPPETPTNVH